MIWQLLEFTLFGIAVSYLSHKAGYEMAERDMRLKSSIEADEFLRQKAMAQWRDKYALPGMCPNCSREYAEKAEDVPPCQFCRAQRKEFHNER